MKTPISYYDGKQQLLAIILPLIPEHKVYTESFFGGGAVYWAKEPAQVEAINDFNGNVVNFYRTLKNKFEQIKAAIDATLHSRETYKYACAIYALPYLFDDVTRAWAFWVATNMGFNNQVGSWAFSTGQKFPILNENKKLLIDKEYSNRMSKTTIESKDACEVIRYWDGIDTFHYVDPPYLNADQGHYGGYTEEHFKSLLNTLSNVKGKFLLSSYPHEMLDEYVQKYGWHQKRLEMHLNASKTSGKKKVEMLTANYEI